MSQPIFNDIHINRPLQNISIAYLQDAEDFVASKVFPNIPVQKQSDLYFSYTQADWKRTGAEVRATGAESAGGGFTVNPNNQYYCKKYAYHQDISDDDRSNQDDPLDLEADSALFVTRNLILRQELDFFNRYFQTGIWQGYAPSGTAIDFTPSVTWDQANSNPAKDVADLIAAIKGKTGFAPNTLTLTYDLYQRLKNHPMTLDRVKYTSEAVGENIGAALLAAMFDVKRVLIASAVYDPSQKGTTPTPGFIGKNKFLLTHSADKPGLRTPSAGYTFSWKGLAGNAEGLRMKTFRIEQIESDRIEGTLAYDQHITGADLGILGTGLYAV